MRLQRIPLSFVGAALTVLAAIWFAVGAIEVQASQEGVFPHHRTDLPKLKNATAGKYLYVGVAPRFEPEDLQLVSSKMGLTLRVTAQVRSELRDTYALQLYKRFKKIADAFLNDPAMGFYPYQGLATLEARAKQPTTKLWVKIVAPYATHVLENQGVPVEKSSRLDKASGLDSTEYKRNVLTALLRYYLQQPDLTLESIPLLDSYFQDPSYVVRLSRDLFAAHLTTHFIPRESVNEKNGKFYVGSLTWVYPIAATTEGPFDQPSEGVRKFGIDGNIESRIWSEKWKDEFGGMPFLLIDWSGVAYHGPITNFNPLDVWFLRRDFVSHGCHRMDSSDVLELRSILPANLGQLEKLKRGIQHVTLNWPDVTDLNPDGKPEVVDVQYYDIPAWLPQPKKGVDLDVLAQKYLGDNAVANWRKEHYSRFNKNAEAKGTPVYDPLTGLYSGLPRYEIERGKLVRKGIHDSLQVMAFPYQPNRILQYYDGRPMPKGFDNRSGKFSPIYFVQ